MQTLWRASLAFHDMLLYNFIRGERGLKLNFEFNDKKCDTLKEYTVYVDKVRRYQKIMSNDEAVKRAVDECIEENVLKDFFMKQKEEVIAMSIFEYDEEAVLDYIGQK